ncbi:hypothetical protein NWP96_01340 [Mycoplasmopsis cynos]|nr:hypothetical protein [Mycoplasmopsis cynos]
MSTKTKRSGAYSIGSTYGINKKYILMNFDGSLRSVETLAAWIKALNAFILFW